MVPTHDNERDFHDRLAQLENDVHVDVTKFFNTSTTPENNFIMRELGDLKGKSILDIGCGYGESSVNFALMGAHCTAVDISPGMLRKCARNARSYGVRVDTVESSAEDIPLPDNSYDIVYGANVLHHAQPERVIREAHRLLRDGGRFCFWDPLRHNPVINVYRRMAKSMRTPDEKPLDINIVKELTRHFTTVVYDTFWISALWIFIRFYLFDRLAPDQHRYWRIVVLEEERLRATAKRLHALDHLLKKIPWVSRLAWNIAVVATK